MAHSNHIISAHGIKLLYSFYHNEFKFGTVVMDC